MVVTRTQYARRRDDVIILVGRPKTKTWWWNFTTDGDIDVLVAPPMGTETARAVIGTDEPETITPLLDAYLERFPLGGSRPR